LVDKSAGFLGHAEASVFQIGRDIFRGLAHESEFKVMNDSSAVESHRVDDAFLHEVYDQRA
jgi:hypothetical protein